MEGGWREPWGMLEPPRGGGSGELCDRPKARRMRGFCRDSTLADVALDGVHVARLGAVGVFAELALGAALAQQVPALVELLGDVPDALGVVAELVRAGAQALLFFDQVGDVLEDRLVVHGRSPVSASAHCTPAHRPGLQRAFLRVRPRYSVRASWVAAWISRPTRPPTSVPLTRMNCRSRPMLRSSSRLISAVFHSLTPAMMYWRMSSRHRSIQLGADATSCSLIQVCIAGSSRSFSPT